MFTWVHVSSGIFSSFLWMVVVEITLFRGLLHINAARLQCIKCAGNNFSLRYICILILFVRAWSSFLSLEIFGGSPRLPKYLLNRHFPYSRGITSSDCTLQPFSYVSLHSGAYLIVYFSLDVFTLLNRA